MMGFSTLASVAATPLFQPPLGFLLLLKKIEPNFTPALKRSHHVLRNKLGMLFKMCHHAGLNELSKIFRTGHPNSSSPAMNLVPT